MPNQKPMPPKVLSSYLGQKFPPTEQQADVIGAEPGPLLVVAGAGAGKTETMAARVVWLVANGYARPEEILGLTFTRKAAQEMNKRIRDRLATLAHNRDLVARLDPSGELAKRLEVIAPQVSTYDSYAGMLNREYGLLVPVEPDSRLITNAELYAITLEVVTNYADTLLPDGTNRSLASVVENVLELMTAMGNDLTTPEWVSEHARDYLAETESLPMAKRSRTEFSKTMAKWRAVQTERTHYLPLAEAVTEELRKRGVTTFNQQMSIAAGLARDHAVVGQSQRSRYRVVMLDEYQDTSHAQRVLLRSLFGEGQDPGLTVTAVGDPMQAIYGWRGATAANLAAFVDDFTLADGAPAPKLQLTTSWRNPPEVLDLANGVSDAILGTGETRAVAPLVARPGADDGDVKLGFFPTQDEEIAFVADQLAAAYARAGETGEPLSAAALVRANKQSPLMAAALEERGVPYEIVGVGGLLELPEIADTVAVATMLVRPDDTAAALRILAGPAVGLGLADLKALASRANNLRGTDEYDDTLDQIDDPYAHLVGQLEELVGQAEDIVARTDRPEGITDALADLGEAERYSEEGLARMRDAAAKLRWLRTHSLGKRLSDLFADIIHVFGIRTEVLSRDTVAGAVHLDRLLEAVSAYPGSSLDGLLDYFDLARKHEDSLAPGAVTLKNDRVQIMTAHKSKGLEWDTVAVLHADARTYKPKTETFLTWVQHLPTETFGDPEIYPVFAEVETRTNFEAAANEWKKTVTAELEEEAARVFYVAVTRAAKNLIVTGSRRRPGASTEAEPYVHFTTMRDAADEDYIVCWDDGLEEADDEPQATHERAGRWPHYAPTLADDTAADAVRHAQNNLPEFTDGELFALWERDVSALIEEHEQATTGDVPVIIPGELTASDVVALKADPEQFARRARRPVPFKPNTYAKRGTAFHEWLEEFYGARPLLTEDELPGGDEADVDRATLERLKRNFEDSEWASRTPTYVEHPFELAIGDAVVRGRMDAVFEDADGWTVVDWKTGEKPKRDAMQSAQLQLAVYREAWRRISGDGRAVHAVFFYVRTGETYAPAELPGATEMEQLLHNVAHADQV